MVFRREAAKIVARNIVDQQLDNVAASAGKIFGWAHPVWQPSTSTAIDLSAVSAEREMGKTVFWLVDTVAPCFQRLCREGIIKDPEQFITRYFLTE